MKKIIKFIIRYIFTDPIFLIKYIFAFPQKNYKPNAQFYSKEEFLNKIKAGKSIIRIGDGEIALLHKRDIHYQMYHKDLKIGLKDIIKKYDYKSSYILSIPLFVNYSNLELKSTNGKLSCWLPLKIEFFNIFNRITKYADAHYFYYRDFMLDFFKEILNNKDIIFITNKETTNSIKNTLLDNNFNSTHYVETPGLNSFDSIEDIKNRIDKILEKNKDIKYKLIISTGPTSKLLAYHYSVNGYQSFDIGFGIRYLYDDKDYSHVI